MYSSLRVGGIILRPDRGRAPLPRMVLKWQPSRTRKCFSVSRVTDGCPPVVRGLHFSHDRSLDRLLFLSSISRSAPVPGNLALRSVWRTSHGSHLSRHLRLQSSVENKEDSQKALPPSWGGEPCAPPMPGYPEKVSAGLDAKKSGHSI